MMFPSSGGGDAAEFERIVHSLEFENQQYVKEIEKERQRITALEQQIEDTRKSTASLQESTNQIDEDTKRYHKQFTHNRDNIESTKKTLQVLTEHEQALEKQYETLQQKGNFEKAEHDQVLRKYEEIWADYKMKYESMPLTKNLQQAKQRNEESKMRLQASKEKLNNIMTCINQVKKEKGKSFIPFTDINSLVVHIAKTKVSTLKHEAMIHEQAAQNAELQAQIKQIRQKQEEVENCRIQQEMEECKAQEQLNYEQERLNEEAMEREKEDVRQNQQEKKARQDQEVIRQEQDRAGQELERKSPEHEQIRQVKDRAGQEQARESPEHEQIRQVQDRAGQEQERKSPEQEQIRQVQDSAGQEQEGESPEQEQIRQVQDRAGQEQKKEHNRFNLAQQSEQIMNTTSRCQILSESATSASSPLTQCGQSRAPPTIMMPAMSSSLQSLPKPQSMSSIMISMPQLKISTPANVSSAEPSTRFPQFPCVKSPATIPTNTNPTTYLSHLQQQLLPAKPQTSQRNGQAETLIPSSTSTANNVRQYVLSTVQMALSKQTVAPRQSNSPPGLSSEGQFSQNIPVPKTPDCPSRQAHPDGFPTSLAGMRTPQQPAVAVDCSPSPSYRDYKTPLQSPSGLQDAPESTEKSPFDIDRHMRYVKSLKFSPGFKYTSRPMIDEEEQVNDDQEEMQRADNPFMQCGHSIFGNDEPTDTGTGIFGGSESDQVSQPSTQASMLFGADDDEANTSAFGGGDAGGMFANSNMFGTTTTSMASGGFQFGSCAGGDTATINNDQAPGGPLFNQDEDSDQSEDNTGSFNMNLGGMQTPNFSGNTRSGGLSLF